MPASDGVFTALPRERRIDAIVKAEWVLTHLFQRGQLNVSDAESLMVSLGELYQKTAGRACPVQERRCVEMPAQSEPDKLRSIADAWGIDYDSLERKRRVRDPVNGEVMEVSQ